MFKVSSGACDQLYAQISLRVGRCEVGGDVLARRTVTVAVGEFGLGSVEGEATQDPAQLSRPISIAIRYYLADQGSCRPEWPYPSFLLNAHLENVVQVRIEIEDSRWEAFSREAERQEVSSDQLAQHAVLYFAADRNAGRLAQRIIEGLDS